MHERTAEWTGLVTLDADLEREFEVRLAECSTLAFRVAFSVLRHREDAEDVAQDAFARAYRRFRELRDRDRFRAWLVRMTWRLALDRLRSDRRRLRREDTARPADIVQPQVEGDERARQLWQAIDTLSEKLRVAQARRDTAPARVIEAAPAPVVAQVPPSPSLARVPRPVLQSREVATAAVAQVQTEQGVLLSESEQAGVRLLFDSVAAGRLELPEDMLQDLSLPIVEARGDFTGLDTPWIDRPEGDVR